MTAILDCTLRDGGYYTSWDFPLGIAKSLVRSLEASGVDIVELGYRSRTRSGFYGAFKYCPEPILEEIVDGVESLRFAVMLDVKEFVGQGDGLDAQALQDFMPSKAASVVDIVRLAATYKDFGPACAAVPILRELGYEISLNLMGIGALSDREVVEAAREAHLSNADIFCFADTYGNFVGEDVARLIELLRGQYHGQLGIHTHDNQGLAYANSLVAIEHGVDIVDGTVTGMGRGAGNARTEQLLVRAEANGDGKSFRPLLPIIEDWFAPKQRASGWGWNVAYMHSALVPLHPTYTMSLQSERRYASSTLVEIIDKIDPGRALSFDAELLRAATSEVLGAPGTFSASSEVASIPSFIGVQRSMKSVLVVARGQEGKRHSEALSILAQDDSVWVLECNSSGVLGSVGQDVVVLNRMRLDQIIDQADAGTRLGSRVILPEREVDRLLLDAIEGAGLKPEAYSCSIQEGTLIADESGCVIPTYDVGAFALALAIASGADSIWLAGFDGHADPELHDPVQNALNLARGEAERRGFVLSAVTPTRYQIREQSVYSLI